EAYGTVDELNSFAGMAASHPLSPKGTVWIQTIQEQLFVLGADLATPPASKARVDRIGKEKVQFLEQAIDEMEEELPELRNFILHGGSKAGAVIHVTRTICRRAERAVIRCKEEESISDEAVKYLNRLSDFFFMMARYENKYVGTPEETWKPER